SDYGCRRSHSPNTIKKMTAAKSTKNAIIRGLYRREAVVKNAFKSRPSSCRRVPRATQAAITTAKPAVAKAAQNRIGRTASRIGRLQAPRFFCFANGPGCQGRARARYRVKHSRQSVFECHKEPFYGNRSSYRWWFLRSDHYIRSCYRTRSQWILH